MCQHLPHHLKKKMKFLLFYLYIIYNWNFKYKAKEKDIDVKRVKQILNKTAKTAKAFLRKHFLLLKHSTKNTITNLVPSLFDSKRNQSLSWSLFVLTYCKYNKVNQFPIIL